MKLFYPKDHYDKDSRALLFPLLKPFVKGAGFSDVQRIELYGISEKDLSFTESIDEAKFVILTMAWNYYVRTGKKNLALELIDRSAARKKTVFIYNAGDAGYDIPFYTNTRIFRFGGYASRLRVNEQILPPFIEDPLFEIYKKEQIFDRPYKKEPTVGFCGQANLGIVNAGREIAEKIYGNLKYYLRSRYEQPQKLMSSSFFRARILKKLEYSEVVKTNFIFRNKYRAGVREQKRSHKTTREFYENINNSDYTVCVRGVGNFSIRLYETLAMGRIPVYVNTDAALPLENKIDWKKHMVWIENHELHQIDKKIKNFHKDLDIFSFQRLQKKNRELWLENLTLKGYFERVFQQD